MRLLFALVYNVFATLFAVLAVPLRLMRPRADFVAFELKGDIPWRTERRRGWARFRHKQAPLHPKSLEALGKTFEAVGRDPKVRGVALRVESAEVSAARLEVVRRLVGDLRAKGKEVVAYARSADTREYALMARASRVQLAPGGRIDLKGFSAELMVFGETLRRLGVRAHFLRRGEYKTAPEQFTEASVSRAQIETLSNLFDEQYARTAARIAEGRGLPEAQVRALIEQGPYTAETAKKAGLVDLVGDGEDLELTFAAEGQKRARLLPIAAYRPPGAFVKPRYRPLRRRSQVALIPVHGIIRVGETVSTPFVPAAAGSDSVVKALRVAREDETIRAAVLVVDSRGGSALASELIHKAVERFAAEKPLVAYVENVAASGGYMAAVGARHFISAPTAIVGSIGVFGGKFDVGLLAERFGVGVHLLQLGRHSGMYSGVRGFTDEERAHLDAEIEETYQSFLQIVARGRKMTVEQVHAVGEGRVFSGQRALGLGLVDALGNFEDAVNKAAELAALPPNPKLTVLEFKEHAMGPFGLRALDAAKLWLPLASERLFALDLDTPLPPTVE